MTKEDLSFREVKGGDKQMEQEEITIKKVMYKEKCPYCDKIIMGTSEGQVNFNLKVHIQTKHPSVNSEDDKE